MLDWGGTIDKGFVPVSRVFLQNYHRLSLSPEEAMLTIHILDYSWGGKVPFPKVATICKYMGRSDKTVRKYIGNLRDLGLLETTNRKGRSNAYDFSPLFEKLKEFASAQDEEDKPNFSDMPKSVIVDVLEEMSRIAKANPIVDDGPEEEEPEEPTPQKRKSAEPSAIDVSSKAGTRKEDASDVTPRKVTDKTPQEPTSPNRRIRSKNKTLKDLSLDEILARNAALGESRPKTQAGISPSLRKQNRRLRKFLEKEPEQYNANDIELVFRGVWKEVWKKTPPSSFTMRDRKHAKDLLDTYGGKVVSEVIRSTFLNWERVKQEFGLKGHPSMPMFWGWRNSIFPFIMEGGVESDPAKPKWGTHAPDDESGHTDEGEELGWGSLLGGD